MNEDRKDVAIVGGMSMMAAMAAAEAAGHVLVMLDRQSIMNELHFPEPIRLEPHRYQALDERLSILQHIVGLDDERPRDAMGFRHVPPEVGMYRGRVYDLYAQAATRLSQTPHIDTPKPVSKRRARRLRGKAERRAS